MKLNIVKILNEIEIVEFYPIKHDKEKRYLLGTLHIYIPALHLDIRGIKVVKFRAMWKFSPVYIQGYDHDEKKPVRYPDLLFSDIKLQKHYIHTIRNKGIAYIKENYLSKPENKEVIPPKPVKKIKEPKTTEEVTEVKEKVE